MMMGRLWLIFCRHLIRHTAYAGTALTDSKDNTLAEDVVIGALKTVKDLKFL